MVYFMTGLALAGLAAIAFATPRVDASPVAAFAGPWAIALMAAAFVPSIHPTYPIVPVLALVGTLLLALGALLADAEPVERMPRQSGDARILAILVLVLVAIGLAGLLVEFATRRQQLLMNAAQQLASLGQIRATQSAGEYQPSAGLRAGIAAVGAASALAGVALGLGRGKALVWVVVLVNLLYAAMAAARAGFALNLLLGLWSWYATVGPRGAWRATVGGARRVALGVLLVAAFILGIDYLRAAGRISFPLMVERMSVQVGGSVHVLGAYIDRGGLEQEPELQLTWLEGPLSHVLNTERTVGLYLDLIPVTERLAPNLYTGFRPLVEDFGWLATFGLLLAAGFLIPRLRRLFGGAPIAGAAFAGWVLATLSWFPVTLPTYQTTWWLVLAFAIAVGVGVAIMAPSLYYQAVAEGRRLALDRSDTLHRHPSQ